MAEDRKKDDQTQSYLVLAQGTTVGHYRIIEKIGAGGMGEVYLAQDTKLDRKVALKFLPANLAKDVIFCARFIREAKAAAKLDHPNIVPIFEVGEYQDRLYYSMAHIEGKSLREVIKQSKLSISDAVNLAIQICEGLKEAHGAGVVHRDIKPANIIIDKQGNARLVDFGLATVSGEEKLTKVGSTLGTVGYMSPEQVKGEEVDHRTDIWALGVVFYEMLSGERPFKGELEQTVLYSIVNEKPKPISEINPSIPEKLIKIVNLALQASVDSRYFSTTDMLQDFTRYRETELAEEISGFNLLAFRRLIRKPRIVLLVVFFALITIGGGYWYIKRQENIHWAEYEALPEIEKLVERNWRDFTQPYNLAVQAENYIPDNPELIRLFSVISLKINIKTDPPGAQVYVRAYQQPESEWELLGTSPVAKVRLPVGLFRFKFEKEGYETTIAASSSWEIDLSGENLLAPITLERNLVELDAMPMDMVKVSGGLTAIGPLNDFYIDKYEVTNRQYKDFIDNNGYKDEKYWQQEFIKERRVLTWNEAMSEFVDQTGRNAPSHWIAGNFPEGEDDFPVSGITWYEAAAYAEYAGKQLPTEFHWGLARGEATPMIRFPQLGGYAVLAPFSNFGSGAPVAVGSRPGITPFGAYDMAGNVREWCWNETVQGRLIRGGAWNDNTYMYKGKSQAPAFDRSNKNGFRCAIYPDPEAIPDLAFAMTKLEVFKDFYSAEPIAEPIFQLYKEQFAYDKTALNTVVESIDSNNIDWIHERISFDAAYGQERIIANLLLPKNVSPPYQAVVYVPGSGALFQNSSKDITKYFEFTTFLSFLVRSGRAVLFPVYKGTFERANQRYIPIYRGDSTHLYTEFITQVVQDFKRSIDYLETRDDIDRDKMAYYGMSWGAILGAIINAVEERPATNILLAGGLVGRGRPEVNEVNYVSRVKNPTLMINGRYDMLLPYESSIRPMYDLLGTPNEHKRLKLFESDHIVPMNDFIRESLTWLDQYLGPVK